ncbi:MAG: VCBS repeat-containing protein [Clostridiales bacterium]|nr:VCBS repeat-containing protein [Clostridiales bacterium]
MSARIVRLTAILLSALMLALLSGCFAGDLDELFSLPQPSEEYLDLQSAIDAVLDGGAAYSAPTGGNNRQSVQLNDIDGDGIAEAFAFFMTPDTRTPEIYIFTNTGSGYDTAAIIEGEGTGTESIVYADMNADGWSEIIVGWTATDLQMLNIYSLKGFQPASVATTDYTKYTVADMDGDGLRELLVVRHSSEEASGWVDMYTIDDEGETITYSAELSAGLKSIDKLTSGHLSDGNMALFVEGQYAETGLITDIFAFNGDMLKNITKKNSSESNGTIRSNTTYCRDINSDGVMDIPIARTLPTTGETIYRVLDWMSYKSDGASKLSLTTFHNTSDGWYLVLPPEWKNDITVRRNASGYGERAVIFSFWNRGQPLDILTIYALTGENREDRAYSGGRFVLRREDEVIYSAKLLEDGADWKYMIDEEYVRGNFSLIYSDWVNN